MALGVPLADDAFLFASAEGRPWRPDVCTNRFGRLRAKLDLDHVRLHDLRHFVASVLIDGGIAISTMSSRLGHSQMSTTLNLYTHAIPATDQKAADYLGDILSQRKPPRAPLGVSPRRANAPSTNPARTHWQVPLREPDRDAVPLTDGGGRGGRIREVMRDPEPFVA